MSYYKRYLKIDLPPNQSAFLWGARKTGKSTFLKKAFPQAPYYDLLLSDTAFRFITNPHVFREEVLALDTTEVGSLIIVDEVQKVPALLDEIHWLIENSDFQFILCGSSARKLKKEGVNMLGGRAWKYHFFPLVYPEFPEFDLLRIFQNGCIPAHYHSSAIRKSLKAYIEDYLTLEIQAEGLVRNLPSFARFLESLRFSHGEMINFSNIARECGIDAKTVKAYFHILIDTLIGYFIYPYRKRVNRQIITDTPKFYLFDVGVANMLMRQHIEDLKGAEAGKALEHYVLMELMAYKHFYDKDFDITYWRTKDGIEVDFVLGDAEVAIEVKIMDKIQKTDLKPLYTFISEYAPRKSYVVSLVPKARKAVENDLEITILPIQMFLEQLWGHQII